MSTIITREEIERLIKNKIADREFEKEMDRMDLMFSLFLVGLVASIFFIIGFAAGGAGLP